MKIKSIAAAVGLGTGLLMAAVPASAALTQQFQDDAIDFLYRPGTGVIDPTTCAGTACNITIGDVLVTVFEYPIYTINGSNAILTGTEVTGVAAIEYVADGTSPLTGDPARLFAAYSGGMDSILALGAAGPLSTGGGSGGSAMVATYVNSTSQDLVVDNSHAPSCTSMADCISQAAQGQEIQIDGGITFNSGTGLFTLVDPDNYWVSGTGGTNIATVLGLSAFNQLVNVQAGLTVLSNQYMPILPVNYVTGDTTGCGITNSADGCVDFLLSASVAGGNRGSAGGGALDNEGFAYVTSITSTKTVPEPATISLLGAALFGLAGMKKRKS